MVIREFLEVGIRITEFVIRVHVEPRYGTSRRTLQVTKRALEVTGKELCRIVLGVVLFPAYDCVGEVDKTLRYLLGILPYSDGFPAFQKRFVIAQVANLPIQIPAAASQSQQDMNLPEVPNWQAERGQIVMHDRSIARSSSSGK